MERCAIPRPQRNTAYQKVYREYRHVCIPVIFIGIFAALTGMMLLLGLVDDSAAAVLLCALWIIVLFAAAIFFISYWLKKYWVCPQCGGVLPTKYFMKLKYVSECPHCGMILEEEASGRPAGQADVQKRKWTILAISTAFILYLAGLMLVSALFLKDERAAVAHSIVLILLLAAAPVWALNCCRKSPVPAERDAIIIYRPSVFLIVGICCVMLSAANAFAGTAMMLVGVPAGGWICGIISMGSQFCGIWLLLGWRHCQTLMYANGELTCISFTGRYRKIEAEQISALRKFSFGSMVQVLDEKGKELFSFGIDANGADFLIELLSERGVSFQGWFERLKRDGENAQGILEWREKDRTRWHTHLENIRIGLILLTCLVSIAEILIFFFWMPKKEARLAFLLFAWLPLLLPVYYCLFPSVLVWAKPLNTSLRWQRMYVSMPNLILLLLGFWIFMVFGAAAETILVVIDLGKLCVVGVVLASTLAGVCIMRTPRRHRTVVAITEICMTALLFAFPLAYSLNWACSGPERHYSIQNIECRMQTNKSGSTASYWLTTTVEGGDEKEFHVEEYLYMAAQNGEPLTVCQRTGLFGIRMAEIHK